MKILYINVFYEPYIAGGAEITLKNLVEGMKEKGHDISVFSLWEGKYIKRDSIKGIKIIRFPIKNLYLPYKKRYSSLKRNIWHLIESYNPFVLSGLDEFIDEFKPDVISIHNTQGWSAPLLWKYLDNKKIPFIQVLHDQYLLCPTNMFRNGKICKTQCKKCKLLRYFYKKYSNKAKAVVGVSKFILNKLLDYNYFQNVKFKEVIYNSRNLNSYNLNLNYRKDVSKDIIFGFIGSIAPNKGIELLLDLFIKKRKNNWKLIIAGSGEESYLNNLKIKYKDENIKFIGKVHPDKFFPFIDVTIVPSLWEEVLGVVVIESFLYGKPVIASKIGGIPEMINKNNGYIFRSNNKEDLYNKMIEFEKNIEKWKRVSKEIQQKAIQKYDYNNWLNKWENLYFKIKDNL